MNRITENALITQAGAEMSRRGVPISPQKVEHYVAAHAGPTAEEIRRELAKPENRNVLASVNEDTGEIGSVGLVPTFKLSDARRTELEQQAKGLQAIIDDPRSTLPTKKKATYELEHIQRLLELDGSPRPAPDQRSPAEREATTTPGPVIR